MYILPKNRFWILCILPKFFEGWQYHLTKDDLFGIIDLEKFNLMEEYMKRIICFFLCLVLVFGTVVLVSCAEKESTKNNDGEAIVIDPEDDYLKKFEDLDFDGYVVKYALSSAEDPNSIGHIACNVEEKNGDTVVDAIYDRNETIKNTINVDIEVVTTTNHTGFTAAVRPSLMAGDTDYDWLWGQQANDIDLCLEGYVYDLNTLSDEVNYIDPTGDWWAGDYMSHYQYKNELYWLSGPLCLGYAGGADCILVNSRLYETNFGESYGNIYDFVREGKWTVDEMAKMSSTIYRDVDNDNKLSDADIFGIRFNCSWCIMRYLIGAGLECSTRNADGSITFGISHTNEEYITLVQKLYSTMNSTPGMSAQKSPWGSQSTFSDGNQLFMFGSLSTMQNFREMEDDFYLIPLPKFDLNQAEYRASMQDSNQIMGLVYTCENIPAATATLEMMAYLSNENVSNVYFNEVLKYKYSRDDDTAEMVQLIHDSVYTDFVLVWELYLFDGNHWLRYDGFVANPASQIKKKVESWTKLFNQMLSDLEGVTVGGK